MEELKIEYNKNLYRFKRYIEFKKTEQYKQNETLYEDEAYKILENMDKILQELETLGLIIKEENIEKGF